MTSSVAIFFISFKKFDLWAMRSQLIEPVSDDEKSCLLHMHPVEEYHWHSDKFMFLLLSFFSS